jgi:hypothetical protein
MSIQVQRVFVRDTTANGGQLAQHSPGNQTYDLVIEVAASPGDNGNQYQLTAQVASLTAPPPPPALPGAMTMMSGQVTTVGTNKVAGQDSDTWTTIAGSRIEGVLVRDVPPLVAAVKDRLFKYFVILRNINAPFDADGAESNTFILQ